MALSVSTDLSVNTGPTYVEEKLEDKQKAIRESIEKGEPRIFGVSQIVIGLLIISYSIPLLFGDTTLILKFGVPFWSGITFVISGAAAIVLEKKPTLQTVSVCLTISAVAIIISVIALILYYVDIAINPPTECNKNHDDVCDHRYFSTHFNTGVKTTISVVGLVQIAISTTFTVILYNQRKIFTGYVSMSE